MPAHMAPARAPTMSRQITTIGPGPPRFTPTYVAKAVPIITWPSWPMLTTPARPLMAVPRATTTSGMAMPMVSPHRPGARRLPSSRAEKTACHEPPVAHTIRAEANRATMMHARYIAAATPASRSREGAGPDPAAAVGPVSGPSAANCGCCSLMPTPGPI